MVPLAESALFLACPARKSWLHGRRDSAGLGIGANVADLAVPHPDRLVELSVVRHGDKIPFSYPMFRELDRGQSVFSGLIGWSELHDFQCRSEWSVRAEQCS